MSDIDHYFNFWTQKQNLAENAQLYCLTSHCSFSPLAVEESEGTLERERAIGLTSIEGVGSTSLMSQPKSACTEQKGWGWFAENGVEPQAAVRFILNKNRPEKLCNCLFQIMETTAHLLGLKGTKCCSYTYIRIETAREPDLMHTRTHSDEADQALPTDHGACRWREVGHVR